MIGIAPPRGPERPERPPRLPGDLKWHSGRYQPTGAQRHSTEETRSTWRKQRRRSA